MSIAGRSLRQQREQLGLSQAKLAELSGVSQHLISSFELEKTQLPSTLLDAVVFALANKSEVKQVAKRTKRYQEHKYAKVQHLPDRVAKAFRTPGNLEYGRILAEIADLHTKEKSGKLSAVSLFSGCGGFSLGFSAAGFTIKGFLELEESLRDIYRANFPTSLELGGDITTFDDASLKHACERLGSVDVIIGGPPCQGFSLSGKRRVDDARNTLFKQYLRFVDVLRPKAAILENVRLLTSMKTPQGGYVKDAICAEFSRHGYKVKLFEINAKEYGVPQHRERVLFIAVREDLNREPGLPHPTHSDESTIFSSSLPYRSFADACSDLPFIESGETSSDSFHEAVEHPQHVIDWLWDVPEGSSAHENEDAKKRPPSGYNTTYKRQVWNEPAATVQTTFGMISGCRNVHPIATRSLTVREAARIQSFPDSFRFVGTLGAIRTGIGNAVPPLLAYQMALYLRQMLLELVKISCL